MTVTSSPIEIMVCVKCRKGKDIPPDAVRPGQALFEEVRAAGLPEGTRLTAVECLQNCDHGCSVALRGGPKRWIYVYGGLDPARDAALLTEGAALYAASEDGVIPWRNRPEHFKRNCVARIPPEAAREEETNG